MKSLIVLAAIFVLGLLCFEIQIQFLHLVVFEDFVCMCWIIAKTTTTFNCSPRILSRQPPTTQRKQISRQQLVAVSVLTFHLISKAFLSEFEALAAPKQAQGRDSAAAVPDSIELYNHK